MWKELLNTKERVKWILETYPSLRDSDNRLIATYWSMEAADYTNYRTNEMTAREFLNLLYKHLLTSPESIRRCRQKIQEESEDLRGIDYKKKQDEAKTITQNIKNL